MKRPNVMLDVCCCEGGASVGYERAGWTVYGVDLFIDYTRDRYPGPVYVGDGVWALKILLAGKKLPFLHQDQSVEWLNLRDFSAIHMSPPCQRHSVATSAIDRSEYPDLIGPLRTLAIESGLPYVIENVVGAPLLDPLLLCGCMFNLATLDDDGFPLRMERPRLFESNVQLTAPRPCYHDPNVWVAGSYGGSRKQGDTPAERRHNAKYVRKGGYVSSIAVQQRLLGIDWMTQAGMHQSVPPVYTEHVGLQLLAASSQQVAA